MTKKAANKLVILGNLLALITAVFVFVPTASATVTEITTTYTYTGNPFVNFNGDYACPPQCGITGFFTVEGSPPINLSGSNQQFQFDVAPLTFSFTDGNVTATNTNSCADFFSISTNGSGNIDSWTIRLFAPSTNAPCAGGGAFSGIQLLTQTGIDITIQAPEAVNFAATPQNPGTWTTAVTPEPGTLLLWVTGLSVMFLLQKRKICMSN